MPAAPIRLEGRTLRQSCAAVLGLVALLVCPGVTHASSGPATINPPPGARLDASPAEIALTFDDPIAVDASWLDVVDSAGSVVRSATGPSDDSRRLAITPLVRLGPGPYTVTWSARPADNTDDLRGFSTFAVGGGLEGVVFGSARQDARAGSVTITLTIRATGNGSSLLHVSFDQEGSVEQMQIDLRRPDLGDRWMPLSRDPGGGWLLKRSDIAVSGHWRAIVLVRQTGVSDEMAAQFTFTIDPVSGAPQFFT